MDRSEKKKCIGSKLEDEKSFLFIILFQVINFKNVDCVILSQFGSVFLRFFFVEEKGSLKNVAKCVCVCLYKFIDNIGESIEHQLNRFVPYSFDI